MFQRSILNAAIVLLAQQSISMIKDAVLVAPECPNTSVCPGEQGGMKPVLIVNPEDVFKEHIRVRGGSTLENFARLYVQDVVNMVQLAWRRPDLYSGVWIETTNSSPNVLNTFNYSALLVRDYAKNKVSSGSFRWNSVFQPYCGPLMTDWLFMCNVTRERLNPRSWTRLVEQQPTNDKMNHWLLRELAPRPDNCTAGDPCDYELLYKAWRTIGRHVVRRVHLGKTRLEHRVDEVFNYAETRTPWLGVIMRLPETPAQRFVTFDEYNALILHFLRTTNGKVIVADNDAYFQARLHSAYGKKNLSRVQRIHILPHDSTRHYQIRKGYVALRTLARCDYLLYASSHVAEAVIYMRPNDNSIMSLEYLHPSLRVPWALAHHANGSNDSSRTKEAYAIRSAAIQEGCAVSEDAHLFNVKACAERHQRGGGASSDSIQDRRTSTKRKNREPYSPRQAVTLAIEFAIIDEEEASSAAHQRQQIRDVYVKFENALNASFFETPPARIVRFSIPVTSARASYLIDEWLTPRLDWTVRNETISQDGRIMRASLHRPTEHPSFSPLMHAVALNQFSSRQCQRVRPAFVGKGFIGSSLSTLSKEFVAGLRWYDAPVVPMVQREWQFHDVDYGCMADVSDRHSLNFVHGLTCYFLSAFRCSEFSPIPFAIKKRSPSLDGAAALEVPIGGAVNWPLLCQRHLSANMHSENHPIYADLSKEENMTTFSNKWHLHCELDNTMLPSEHLEENEDFRALLGSAGDIAAWVRWIETNPPIIRLFGDDPDQVSDTAAKSLLFWGITLATVLRPNAKTRAEIADRIAQWRTDNPDWNPGNKSCAAMHIRHGDKLTTFWKNHKVQDRGFNRSLDEYVKAAGTNTTQILFMTDDQDIVDEAPRVAAASGVRLFTVPPGRRLVSTSKVQKRAGEVNHQRECHKALFNNMRKFNKTRDEYMYLHATGKDQTEFGLDLQKKYAKAKKRAERAPAICAHDYSRDPKTGKIIKSAELLQWFTTWELMAECSLFIAFSLKDSFFTELIYAWLCYRRFLRDLSCPRLVLLENIPLVNTR